MWNQTRDESLSEFQHLKSDLERIETPCILVIAIMGFIGACFSSTVFLKEERSGDFFLYKIISFSEAAQMFLMAAVRWSSYLRCEKSYLCSIFWAHLSIAIMNSCADVVDFLILFVCVERAWACLLPFEFKNLNKRLLERVAVLVAFLNTLIFSLFQAFEVTVFYHHDRYLAVPSKFAESRFYSILKTANSARFYITACAIVIATTLSIFGFWRTSRRSTILSKNRDKSREIDLCCLQLCTAAPVVVNQLLYALSINMSHYSYDDQMRLLQDNSSIRLDLKKAGMFEYLKSATNLSDTLAHALQFYFYLIFCMKIRQGFVNLFRRKVNAYTLASTSENTPMLANKKNPVRKWWPKRSQPKVDRIESNSNV